MEPYFKVLQETNYTKIVEGVSLVSGMRLFIKGERTIELQDGRIVEQYIYEIEGIPPKPSQPYAAIKDNIVLTQN